MFNLYQTMNRHGEAKEQKEPETTGHDRFYQERVGRSSYRKKKKKVACRRAQSAAELNPASIALANRKAAFRTRSVSTENETDEESCGGAAGSGSAGTDKAPLVTLKIDSLAKLLFSKSLMGTPSGSQRGSPVEDNPKTLANFRCSDRNVEKSAVTSLCMDYVNYSNRYELITELNKVGSRQNKDWFAIKDCSIKAERLLMMTPLGNHCCIELTERSRTIIMELFRGLHHPYIYPVLDVAFFSGHSFTIIPYNPKGSLKDLIYGTEWRDEWSKKHETCDTRSGNLGLPLWQVGRLGRQILEGLLFLNERGFPPFRHLHSGNIIVQNGVARICGLENTLLGLPSKTVQRIPQNTPFPEVLAFGHLLFEMCAGYELDVPAPTPGHLQLDLERYPQIAEIMEAIFSTRTPSITEVVLYDLFRKIDLREMKGSCLPNFNQRVSRSCAGLLGQVTRGDRAQQQLSGGPAMAASFRVSSRIVTRSAGCSPVTTPTPTRRRLHSDDDDDTWYF